MKNFLKTLITISACAALCFCAACTPRHTHKFKYEANGDGAHTAICDDCNYVKIESCNSLGNNGSCTLCGYVDISATAMTQFIDGLIDGTPSYIPAWNKEGFKGRWNYIDGVFLNSVVQLYAETQNVKYKNFFIKYLNYYIGEDGNFTRYKELEQGGYEIITTGNEGFNANELDSVCASRVLFDAYDMTGDDRYLTAIEHTYSSLNSMPRVAGTQNFVHKTGYRNQVWLDGMYMYAPFLARYAKMKNNAALFTEIADQYQFIRDTMRDEQTGLYHHGIYMGNYFSDEAAWASSSQRTSSSFWLRAEGWLLASLADVIEYFPDGADKDYLTDMLAEAVADIYAYRDESTGMFYQLIDMGEFSTYVGAGYLKAVGNKKYGESGAVISNYAEASGSSILAYVMMKGARLGYLSSDYAERGKSVYRSVYTHSFSADTDELRDICITAGLGDTYNATKKTEKFYYRDGTPAYYLAEPVGSNDAKGVGPFIMGYIQYIV